MDLEDDEEGSSGLDSLRDPMGIVRRRWRPIALALGLGLCATLAAVWLVEPMFQARASVLIASQKLSTDFVRPTIQEDAIERINALSSEVLSSQSLSELLEQHGLYRELVARQGTNAAVTKLRSKITIELDPGLKADPRETARVVLVGFKDGNAERSAEIANELARRLIEAGIRMRSQQARITTEFMRQEFETAEAALREQTKQVSEFQGAHRGELPSELESNLRRLERLQQQRNSLALQIAGSETRIASLGTDPGSPQARLADLKAELARTLAVSTELHPNVQSLRHQIEAVEQEIGGAPGSAGALAPRRSAVSDAAQRELAQLREQLAETDRDMADLDAKVARIPARQQELDALVQRETVLRESYLEFSRKLKDAELAESLEQAQQGDRVSILDPATVPEKPARPSWLIALVGVIGSLGGAAAVGLFFEWLDPLIMTTDALEDAAGVPVLGSLPHIAVRS